MNQRKRHEKLTSTLGTVAASFTEKEQEVMKKYGLDPGQKTFILLPKFLPNQKPKEITDDERQTLEAIQKKLPDLAVIELSPDDEKL